MARPARGAPGRWLQSQSRTRWRKNLSTISLQYKIQPWAHQLEAIEKAVVLDEFALFFEMGAGKTSTCINILRHKFAAKKRPLRTLILCPAIVRNNWKREWLLHSKMLDQEILVLDGRGDRRAKLLREKAMGKNPEAKIVVTNFEGLRLEALWKELLNWKPEVLVVDESHRIKNPKAATTKRCITLADETIHRYLLSGTPILKDPMDLFSQFRVLDRGKTFGTNFFTFRQTYFFDQNSGMPKQKYFPDWRLRPKSLEEINVKLKARSMSVKKSDCLDLPPLVRQVVDVELSPEQRRMYEEMKTDFVTTVRAGVSAATPSSVPVQDNDGVRTSTAQLALTKGLRLLQILSGFVVVDDGESGKRETVALESNARAVALADLLETITPGAKVLVWAVFKENYAAIRKVCENLKIKYVEVHGDVPDKQKSAAVDAFNTDPSVRVFIGHPGSGGIGINLVAASYSIFYSRSFSLEQDLQAEARNYRGGSEIHEKVTRIDLVARGTIEELVLARLAQKLAISDAVLKNIAAELEVAPKIYSRNVS